MAALEAFLLVVALQVGMKLSKEYRKALLIVCIKYLKDFSAVSLSHGTIILTTVPVNSQLV